MKKFLKRNEIYFTTISSFFLSGMAIIVSWISIDVSKKQYELDYFEKSPDFQIQEVFYTNPKTQFVTDSKLIFTKVSGKAKNIHIDIITLVDLELTNRGNESVNKIFKLDNYYNLNFLSGRITDTIQMSTGKENHSMFVDFQRNIENRLEEKYQYAFCDLKTYVKMSFLNFENKKKNEYYQINSFTGEIMNDTIVVSKYFDLKSEINHSLKRINLNKIDEMDLSKLVKSI
ncbi:hypothetical protein Flavo103_11070 [Flavobacterium collinsii]|uniref:hypothetical protein n=1 Tax=Flavobacterium collinsii TaxID=1114861 RepID=UPI0022C51AED|nr:hypothetical protein [Flavobacterium collinsii]GIQ57971.1 hypothetical protein Flavo103_11070 [Flavobacterium collinsii]